MHVSFRINNVVFLLQVIRVCTQCQETLKCFVSERSSSRTSSFSLSARLCVSHTEYSILRASSLQCQPLFDNRRQRIKSLRLLYTRLYRKYDDVNFRISKDMTEWFFFLDGSFAWVVQFYRWTLWRTSASLFDYRLLWKSFMRKWREDCVES